MRRILFILLIFFFLSLTTGFTDSKVTGSKSDTTDTLLYANVSKKVLQQNFKDGDKIYDWLISKGYAVEKSNLRGRIYETVDMANLKANLEKEFPLEADRLLTSLQNRLYEKYLRKVIYNVIFKDIVSKIDLKRNYKVKVEFDVAFNGALTGVSVIPLSKGVPESSLKQILNAINKLGTVNALPESFVQYHKGFFSKKLFGNTFLNGDKIYGFLKENNYLEKTSNSEQRPITLTDSSRTQLMKTFPKQFNSINKMFHDVNQKTHRFKVEVDFEAGNWLERLIYH